MEKLYKIWRYMKMSTTPYVSKYVHLYSALDETLQGLDYLQWSHLNIENMIYVPMYYKLICSPFSVFINWLYSISYIHLLNYFWNRKVKDQAIYTVLQGGRVGNGKREKENRKTERKIIEIKIIEIRQQKQTIVNRKKDNERKDKL